MLATRGILTDSSLYILAEVLKFRLRLRWLCRQLRQDQEEEKAGKRCGNRRDYGVGTDSRP